jgi:Annexin
LATFDATGRYKLSMRYKELFNESLAELMKKEFSGAVVSKFSSFGAVMEFLAMPSHEAECAMLYKATKGVGASANVIYAIMCGRTNVEMELIKKTYFKMYTKDLGKLMASELHGEMERIIFNCMQSGEEVYDPQFHTADKVLEDIEQIYSAGQGRWGTDEKSIFKLLCAAPPEHVQNLNKAYSDKYGYSLMKALEKELSGNVRDATVHMIGMKIKPYETIAALIKKACAGM